MAITPERQAYMDSVRQKLADGLYIDLLESEGELINSAEFRQAAFAEYTPTKADIIVSTWPKSGTNWMMNIAQEIAWYGEAEFEHVNSAIPWPDATIKTDIAQLSDTHMADKSPTGLRVIKSHLAAEYVPITDDSKYIVVVRDPKDALVSSYHFENSFIEKMVGDRVPLSGFVNGFLAKRFVYAGWADHTASWWKLRQQTNVLILFFAEMKQDLKGAIAQVARFLGVDLTAEQFNKVADKASYTSMKTNNHKFSPPTPPDYAQQGHITMVRSGKPGEAQEALTAVQQQAIDNFCQTELERLNSDFPFATKFT